MLLKRVFNSEILDSNRKLIEKNRIHGRQSLTDDERRDFDSLISEALEEVRFTQEPAIGGRQVFSTRFVEQQSSVGLLVMDKDTIVLNTTPKLTFKIKQRPGYFCCFDNKPMDDGGSARQYIQSNFKGEKSPDPANPAGYRRDNFYLCERVS